LRGVEEVTGRTGDEYRGVGSEHLTQIRDVDPERVLAAGGTVNTPQLVDQTIGGHDPAGMDEKNPQYRALLPRAHRDRFAGEPHLERTESTDPQTVPGHVPPRRMCPPSGLD
jgi:hypothetical protein